MNELPIVCTLDPDQLEQRRRGLLADLLRAAQEIHPLDEGYRVRISADAAALDLVLQVIRSERACCRFLEFDLRFEPALGPVWLHVNGPAGTKEFLDSLLSPA